MADRDKNHPDVALQNGPERGEEQPMKKLISVVLTLSIAISAAAGLRLSAAAANISYNNEDIYLRQKTTYTCTLASSAMLLRRRAIMNGVTNWNSITESSMRSTAWVENSGLRNSFTYAGMKTVCKAFIGDTYSELSAELIALLNKYPCGIVIYSKTKTHAVFLTDYDPTSDTFYCMDPASTAPSGKVALKDSTLGKTQKAIIQILDCYWYVSSSAYLIGEFTVNNGGNSVNLYSAALSTSTKLGAVPSKTLLKITAVTGQYGQTVYNGKSGWVLLTACDYTTKAYQLIYLKNGGNGTQMENTVCFYGRNNYLSKCAYTRSNYHFTGWYIYRPSDHKWLYTNGTSNAWSIAGEEGAGYSKSLMQPGAVVLKLCTYYGGQVYLYAQWEPGTESSSAVSPSPIVSVPEPEETSVPDEEPAPTGGGSSSDGAPLESGLNNFALVVSYTNGQFSDVDENQWYGANGQGSIKAACELGLMNGVGSGNFDPNGEITVAQAVTIACRLHCIYYSGQDSIEQSQGDWFAAYMSYANANGVVPPGFLLDSAAAKNTKASRGLFAYILSGALPSEALQEINDWPMGSIPDVSASTNYSAQIYTLYRAGILSGSDSVGTFLPDSYISRSQTAAIIARMADVSKRV
ncbi:MAG: S-layer homology domain-containing protein [Clostridia bacterium]|nr:S-layer homology domain-containing protein [Clostridia bacterium]